MLSYKEYEKKVFDWLMAKHRKDPNFTFSTRLKASKGAELDYFIGTEKSNYFGTTFWNIPTSYPGSSMDLIDVFFCYGDENTYYYYFETAQTKLPHDKQNESALKLIQLLKPKLKNVFGLYNEGSDDSKIETCNTYSESNEFSKIDDLLLKLDEDLGKFIQLVDETIKEIKLNNKEFEAHRISKSEFDKFQEKLQRRLEKYFDMTIEKSDSIELNAKSTTVNTLNTILFGPPGTGKTYTLQHDYFLKYTERQESKTRQQIILEMVSELSWWEVIGAALKIMGPSLVPDIAKHEFVVAKTQLSTGKTPKATIWNQLQHHTIKDCDYVNLAARSEPQIFTKNKDSVWSLTKNAQQEAPQIFDFVNSLDSSRKGVFEKKNYMMTTFHQNFSYEDFIEGIKPRITEDEESLVTYEIQKGLFYLACEKAVQLAGYPSISACLEDTLTSRKEKLSSAKPFAFFIDEINRANVSSVFGELITLLEDDKRLGAENEITDIKLPYSKTGFGVPMNLHVTGTMNTADRSVEALDTALRRRFSFIEMAPQYDLPELQSEVSGIKLGDILYTINKRIEKLLDKDHLIGHSYFIGAGSNMENLKVVFGNKILPLLQEYFFGDYSKIGLVLGEGFFEKQIDENENVFARFRDTDISELAIRPVYRLKDLLKMENEEFKDALNQMMGRQ